AEDRVEPVGSESGPARAVGSAPKAAALTPSHVGVTKNVNFDAHPRSSLIVALDFDSLSSATKFAKQVADLVGMFKIGNQLFSAADPAAVSEIDALVQEDCLNL